MSKAIELSNISYSYGDRSVLTDINFSVSKGKIHGLIGPNGAGKTTTMKLILQMLSPDEGELVLDESAFEKGEILPQNIGFLLDTLPLYEEMRVSEFLLFLAKLRGVEPEKIDSALNYCLRSLDLEEVKDRLIANLSKGFTQRVAIAQALIHNPEIVILDEPTLGLDPQSIIEIRNLLLGLKNEHTLLVSSHLLHEMSMICDEITILMQGQVIHSGPISELENTLSRDGIIEVLVRDNKHSLPDLLEKYDKAKIIHQEQINSLELYRIKPSIASKDIRAELSSLIIKEGIDLYKIDRTERTLEEIFIGLTQK